MEQFKLTLQNFSKDLIVTFPELSDIKSIQNVISGDDEAIRSIIEHASVHMSQHLTSIINEDSFLFAKKTTFLFPDVDFSILWDDRTTATTKTSIWSYLKLLSFMLIGYISSTSNAMEWYTNTDIMKSKKDTNFMDKIMESKMGSLIKELMSDFGDEPESMEELLKDPMKLIGIFTSLKNKLESKVKNGQINKEELMNDLMSNMKGMPGVEELMKSMGQKPNKTKQRLQAKMKQRQKNNNK